MMWYLFSFLASFKTIGVVLALAATYIYCRDKRIYNEGYSAGEKETVRQIEVAAEKEVKVRKKLHKKQVKKDEKKLKTIETKKDLKDLLKR